MRHISPIIVFVFLIVQFVQAQEAKPDPAVTAANATTAGSSAEAFSQSVHQLLSEGNQLYEAKDVSGATKLYEQAVALSPDSFAAWFNLGIARVAAGQYESALVALNRAQALGPESARTFTYLGVAYKSLNKEAEAITAYKTAIRMDPNSSIANNNLGFIYLEQHRYGDAQAYFKRAVEITPDSKSAVGGLCVSTSFLREHVEALEACTRAAQLNGPVATFHYLTGIARYNLEQYQDAMSSYETAQNNGFNSALTANGIAYCLLKLGEHKGALQYFQKAVSLNPKLVEAHTGMGAVYYSMNRFKDAANSFKLAVAADPNSTDARYSLAVSCLTLKRRDCALEQYNSLKQLDTTASNKLFAQIFHNRLVDARAASH